MFFQHQKLNLLLDLYFCFVLGLTWRWWSCSKCSVTATRMKEMCCQLFELLIPFECVSQLLQIKASEKEPLIVVIRNFKLTLLFLLQMLSKRLAGSCKS